MDHKSINSGPIYKFETDPRLRKYLETFYQLRLFATPWLLQNSFAMISLHWGIRTLLLDHILDHNSINSGLICKFETDPRLRNYLETFCQLRLSCTVVSGHKFWTTYRTTSPSILVQFSNLRQIRGRKNSSKRSTNSDCLQRHFFKICLRGYRSTVASGLNFWTTYWTTSPSILVQCTNLREIQDWENVSKLSTNSDCLQRHSLKICLQWYCSAVASGLNFWTTTYWTTSTSILVQCTNLRQIKNEKVPRNFLPTQIVCNAIDYKFVCDDIDPLWHPVSISGPHIGPQVHQFWSN